MAGGKQIIHPTMKDMYKYVSVWVCEVYAGAQAWWMRGNVCCPLQCDGKNLDAEIEAKKLQGIIFLNINRYAVIVSGFSGM